MAPQSWTRREMNAQEVVGKAVRFALQLEPAGCSGFSTRAVSDVELQIAQHAGVLPAVGNVAKHVVVTMSAVRGAQGAQG